MLLFPKMLRYTSWLNNHVTTLVILISLALSVRPENRQVCFLHELSFISWQPLCFLAGKLCHSTIGFKPFGKDEAIVSTRLSIAIYESSCFLV